MTTISSTTVAPSPSATIWRARSAQTVCNAPANAGVVARGIAGAVGEEHHRIVRRAVPVDGDPIERPLDRRSQEGGRLALVEWIVGGDDDEHRRETGMDHPRPLRHPADGESPDGDLGKLRARVGGENRACRLETSCRRELCDSLRDAGPNAIERQLRPDHAGRQHNDLVGSNAEQRGDALGGRNRVCLTLGACGGIRHSCIHHHGLWRGLGEMPAGDDDGSGLETIGGPHRSPHRRHRRADERDVGRAGRANACRDAGRFEPLRRSHGHQLATIKRAPRSDAGRSSPEARRGD